MGFAYVGLETEELKKGKKAEKEKQRVRLGELVRRLQPATAPPAVEKPEVKDKVEPPQPVSQPSISSKEVIEEKKAVVVYQAPSGYVRPVMKEEKTLYVWMEPSLDILKVRLEGGKAIIYAVNETSDRYQFYVEWSNTPYLTLNVAVYPGETKDLVRVDSPGDIRLYYVRTPAWCIGTSGLSEAPSPRAALRAGLLCQDDGGFIDIKLAW